MNKLNKLKLTLLSALLVALLATSAPSANAQQPDHPSNPTQQDHASCPLHQKQDHHAGVNERGDKAMGFSHQKTTHHFLLFKDGGAIDVSANDATDTASRDQIRGHLTHIAQMFTDGDFSTPMLVHDRVPPGADGMKKKKQQIRYTYEETEKGARVRILTTDKKALAAVHDFLRFQIEDHKTGDPLTVSDK